ncbi:MAG: hypothetical protein IT374_26235 [Polyangiaceae bacterium]|nr:hypothetical protein [Polyangiaceae bacterium]
MPVVVTVVEAPQIVPGANWNVKSAGIVCPQSRHRLPAVESSWRGCPHVCPNVLGTTNGTTPAPSLVAACSLAGHREHALVLGE